LLAVLAVAWNCVASYGIGVAWYALLMLPTSVAMIGLRVRQRRMLFAGLLTASDGAAGKCCQNRALGRAADRVCFFLGAAVLAKGPAA